MKNINEIANINFDVNNPDNIRLYHGTTHTGGQSIPIEGFCINPDTVWDCSSEDEVYFYDLNEFIKKESLEDDDFKSQQYQIIKRCNENAQIQEAILNNPSDSTYVLEFVLPPEAKELIHEDTSTLNAYEYNGFVSMDILHINKFIKEQKCVVNVYKFPFYPKMSYIYLNDLIDNPFTKEYFDNIPTHEKNVIQILNKCDTYEAFECIVLECEYEFVSQYGPQIDYNRSTGEY